jgi:hypothetical protein
MNEDIWTAEEKAAYRAWMFSGEDGEPGEGWEIQERAWVGGYRAFTQAEHEHDPGGCTCGCPVAGCLPCGGEDA